MAGRRMLLRNEPIARTDKARTGWRRDDLARSGTHHRSDRERGRGAAEFCPHFPDNVFADRAGDSARGKGSENCLAPGRAAAGQFTKCRLTLAVDCWDNVAFWCLYHDELRCSAEHSVSA